MKRLLSRMALLVLISLSSLACQVAHAGPRLSGEAYNASLATYKIVAHDKDPLAGGEATWSGTAWKISDTEMVTAGHVCHNHLGWAPSFRVYNTTGQSWPATVIAYEFDDRAGTDLCVLKASPPGTVLRLAPDLPAYDADLVYVGAPHGVWTDGMKPVYHGYYAGGSLAVIGGAPGASGSAMLSKAGVVGVLVAGIESGNLIFFIPVQTLKEFLTKNGV